MMRQELLTLIVVIPLFLFLSGFFSQTHLIFIGLWFFCLGFDMYSTFNFYMEDPANFENNERNKLFSGLTKKFGFKKASLLFPILIEIPLLLFFAFLPLQILHSYMFPNNLNSFIVCLAASFGIAAIGHFQAATKNIQYHNKHDHKQNGGAPWFGCKTRH